MSSLSSLVTSDLPSETVAVQQKAYVTYAWSFGDDEDAANERAVTLLEARSIISSSGSTGLRTWEAALHLAAFLALDNQSVSIRDRTVLELGAGSGFLSIFCAKHLGAKSVMATDGDETVVDALKTNIFLNGLEGSGKIDSCVLRWGRTLTGTALEEQFEEHPLDLVMAADVV